jgi:MFS family permease
MAEPRDTERRAWAVVTFVFAALAGVLLQARGALMPSFQDAFGVSEGQLGLVAPLATLGYLASTMLVGMYAGRVDMKRLFLVSIGGVFVMLLFLGWSPTFELLLLFAFLRMIMSGVGRALDRPILSHLYPQQRPRMYSLYDMSWAIGATLGPILVTVILVVGDWRLTYWVVAVGFVVLFAAVWRLDLPADDGAEQTLSLADLRALGDHPTIRIMVLALVFAVGVEAGIFTWLPFYAKTFLPRDTANLLLSAYLVAYVPGRYAASRVVDRFGAATVLLASALGGTLPLVGALVFRTALPLFLAVFALGFFVATVFPTALSWGTDAAPEFSGPVNAIANAAATSGFFVVPPVVGVLAERYDIRLAMWVLALLMAGLVVLSVVVRFRPPEPATT